MRRSGSCADLRIPPAAEAIHNRGSDGQVQGSGRRRDLGGRYPADPEQQGAARERAQHVGGPARPGPGEAAELLRASANAAGVIPPPANYVLRLRRRGRVHARADAEARSRCADRSGDRRAAAWYDLGRRAPGSCPRTPPSGPGSLDVAVRVDQGCEERAPARQGRPTEPRRRMRPRQPLCNSKSLTTVGYGSSSASVTTTRLPNAMPRKPR